MFDEFKSIVPIMHPATRTTPDVFGTGTLIRVRTHSFLITAAHVLDEAMSGKLLVPLEGRLTGTARKASVYCDAEVARSFR